MRASFWPIYASYGSLCKRPRNLLPQRPETSSTSAFPLSNKFIDGPPPTPNIFLVDHFGYCSSTNPSAAPLGLMLTYCLPWVWFCAPRHLERPPRHRRLWPSRTSLPRPDRLGFIALWSWEGPHRWRPPEGVPISNLPNWITYFQSSFNPSNWSRHLQLIDDFASCAKIYFWSNREFLNHKSLLLQIGSPKSLTPQSDLNPPSFVHSSGADVHKIWTLMMGKRDENQF